MSHRFNDFIRAYSEFAVRRRLVVFVLVAILVGVTGPGLLKLQFQTDYRVWWSDDAPELIAFDVMVDKYGSDDTALVTFRDPERGMMNNHAVAAIQRITSAFWTIPGVKRVDALGNFASIRASRMAHESPGLAASAQHVAAPGDHGEVYLFDLADGSRRTLAAHEGVVEHLAFSASGATLWSAGIDRVVIKWDVASGEQKLTLRGLPQEVSALALSPDESRIYAASLGTVIAFDTTTGARLWVWQGGGDFLTRLVTTAQRVYAADKDLHTIDAAKGETIATRTGHGGFINALLITPDLGHLISAADDGRVLVWSVEGGEPREALSLPSQAALSLAFMPNSAQIVAGFTDGTVRAVPFAGGRPVVTRAHTDWVVDLSGDPNGHVYSASRDRNVAIHVPGEGPVRVTLEAHRAAVRRVLRGPNGQLFTSGDEGDVYVWEPTSYEMLARLSRARMSTLPGAALPEGRPVGALEISNGFRYPVEIAVGGQRRTALHGGKASRIDGLPVPDPKSCESDDDCQTGQYCDYEASEPYCAGELRVEAFLPGTAVRVWAGSTFLLADKTVVLRVPADEPFAVTELARPPLDPRSRAGALLAAFPSPAVASAVERVLGADASYADTFISPALADRMADLLRQTPQADRPEDAIRFLSTLAQVQLEALRLPIQPYRYREAAHHLMRQPDPAAKGAVLNTALDTTIILVSLHLDKTNTQPLDELTAIRAEMEKILAAESAESGYFFHLVGDVILDTTAAEFANRDIAQLMPAFFGVIALMLLLLYRRISGVLLPLGLVGVSIIVAMGVAGHLGAHLDNLSVIVPQIVLASCIGDAVHLFSAYADRVRAGMSPREATLDAVTVNFAPCLWTTTSTAIGFFSLSWSSLAPVGMFGWMSGIGVVTAFIMSFLLLPGIMVSLPVPKKQAERVKAGQKDTGFDAWLDDRMVDIAGYVLRTRWTVVVMGTIVSTFLILGLRFISFDSNPLEFFDEDVPIREAAVFIEEHIAGPTVLRLDLITQEAGAIRTVKYLDAVGRLRDHIAKSKEVVAINCLADVMRSMNRVMNRDLDENYSVPVSDEAASSYYDAYTFSLRAGMELTNRVSADESSSLMDVRFIDMSSGEILAWGNEVTEWSQKNVPELQVVITGKNWLFANVLKGITRGMFENVGSAVVLISLFMFVLARRFKLGMVAASANVIPLLITVGILAYRGTALDLSIVISCCVGIGIIVDDSIHFVAKYKRLREKGKSHDEATIETIRVAGKAMVFTTTVLVVGLGMFLFSEFQANANFGAAAALMLALGLLFDLTVLPAALGCFASDIAPKDDER